jgi:hypothetical protein
VPETTARLSRLYLIPALAVAILGPLAVRAHLNQPHYLPGPGLGCVVTTIPSPDTLHVPASFLELQACPHINETTLELRLHSPNPDSSGYVFNGSGPEDPHRWAETLSIRWASNSLVHVRYEPDVTFLERHDTAGPVHIRYTSVPRGGV